MKLRPHSGFTLIELLVVVSIIAILASMVFAALGMLTTNAKRETSKRLIRDVGQAISVYLQDYAQLGGNSPAFNDNPWLYLGIQPTKAGKPYYIELTHKNLKMANGAGATIRDGEVIIDEWKNPIIFEVTNETRHNRNYTAEVTIRGTMGTPRVESDDWVYWYKLGFTNWVWKQEGEKAKTKDIEALENQ